jgi:hypothetical protein
VPADSWRALGAWRCDMRVNNSAVQKRDFPNGPATGAAAELKHRAPLGSYLKGDLELSRVETDSFSPRRCEWSSRPTSAEPTIPAGGERRSTSHGATSASPHPGNIHSATPARGFNRKDRAGWSNEGREVFGAWLLVLLGAALAVLLLASHQTNTSGLRSPQWSDPPVAGVQSSPDDLARVGDE